MNKTIALVVKNGGFVRYLDSVILGLAEKNKVYLCFEDPINDDHDGSVAYLQKRNPNIEISQLPPNIDLTAGFFFRLLWVLDLVRYLDPQLDQAKGLKKRAPLAYRTFYRIGFWAANLLPKFVRKPLVALGVSSLRALFRLSPPNKKLAKYFDELDADLVLTTGLVWPRSPQANIVLTAKRLNLPVGYIVNSWDNLTNKGDLKILPDRLFVWNELQKREAIRLHKVPSQKIDVIGASLFDKWFDLKPKLTREEFLSSVGLDHCDKIVLYLGSSPRISEQEGKVIQNWLTQLRANSDFSPEKVGVIVRPHPMQIDNQLWTKIEKKSTNTRVFPKINSWVVTEEQRLDFYHSLYYADSIVAVNTSAILEAAILGKRVLSISSPEVEDGQSGTIHFTYLEKSGFVHSDKNLQNHFQSLRRQLYSDQSSTRQVAQFNDHLKKFVRPFGLDKAHTSIAISKIMALVSNPLKKPLVFSFSARVMARLYTILFLISSVPYFAYFGLRTFLLYSIGLIIKTMMKALRSVANPLFDQFSEPVPNRYGQPFQLNGIRNLDQRRRLEALNYYNLGSYTLQMDSLKRARDLFKKSAELDPNNLEAVHAYADLSCKLGDINAVNSVVPLLESHPTYEGHIRRLQSRIKDNNGDTADSRFIFNSHINYYLRRFKDDFTPPQMTLGLNELQTKIEEIQKASQVVVGPWMSEIGFEVLYWIPFVRHILKAAKVDPSKVTVVSRGGVSSWYKDFAANYIDLYEHLSSDQFFDIVSRRKIETGKQKQTTLTREEDIVMASIFPGWHGDSIFRLHPSLMHKQLTDFWKGRVGQSVIDQIMSFRPASPAKLSPEIEKLLPERYFAVKFYFRESFPDNAENRELIKQTLRLLANYLPVISLETGLKLDEHEDFYVTESNHRIISVSSLMSYDTNLETQTAIIQRSSGFIGTYGGLVYLAGFAGKQVFTFESDPESNRPTHLALANIAIEPHGPQIEILRDQSELWILEDHLKSNFTPQTQKKVERTFIEDAVSS